jgi:hypothetical protein
MKETRRPIKSRSNTAIRKLAEALAHSSITPNQISAASVVFAAIGALALPLVDKWWAMPIALAAIQLRLLCNVLDGLVAVEGGKKSALGALYNEFPDRVADSLLIVGAGYCRRYAVAGLGCSPARRIDGLCPRIRRLDRPRAALPRPDGEAAPDGGAEHCLRPDRRRGARPSSALQFADRANRHCARQRVDVHFTHMRPCARSRATRALAASSRSSIKLADCPPNPASPPFSWTSSTLTGGATVHCLF